MIFDFFYFFFFLKKKKIKTSIPLQNNLEPSVGNVKPSDLDVTCEEVVKAATDLQGFRNDSPEQTRDKADDTSRKAAKYAAQVKALANKTTDPTHKKRLEDAYRDLVDANEGVVEASNDYLGDPDSKARQDELHEAAENLKRAARAALAAARPKVDMSGEIPNHRCFVTFFFSETINTINGNRCSLVVV